MKEEKNLYTVSIYTEDNVGLLNRISAIFQRRHINIESLSSSVSEIEGVSRFTLLVHITEEQMRKILGQIEKQVEVIKAYYHTDEQTIYQESCLFKVKSDLLFEERQIQNIILVCLGRITREHHSLSHRRDDFSSSLQSYRGHTNDGLRTNARHRRPSNTWGNTATNTTNISG